MSCVNTVVGGFHLLDNHESEDKLSELAFRLTDAYPQTQFHTSHCTGDAVFATLHQVMGDKIHAFSCGITNNDKVKENGCSVECLCKSSENPPK